MRAERYYKQDITYWAPGPKDEFGSPAFGTPTPFLGRWEFKEELVIGGHGETINTSTIVNYPQDLNIEQDGYLFLGRSTATDPRKVTGAYKVQVLSEIPDLRMLQTIKVAMM